MFPQIFVFFYFVGENLGNIAACGVPSVFQTKTKGPEKTQCFFLAKSQIRKRSKHLKQETSAKKGGAAALSGTITVGGIGRFICRILLAAFLLAFLILGALFFAFKMKSVDIEH